MKTNAHKRALLLMIIAPTMWSMAGVLTRQLDSVRGFEVSFWRSLSAAVFVFFALLFQHRQRAGAKILALGSFGVLSGFMWAIMFSCFMLALTMTTVANALIVMSLSPLLTALFSRLFLHQTIPVRTWIAIVLAFLGMIWMFVDGFSKLDTKNLAGVLVAMCVPVAVAVNFIALKKGGQTIDLMPAVLIGGALSAIFMLPLALPFSVSAHDLLILVCLGFFQLGLPCMIMVHAAKSLSAPELSLLSLLEVLLGPLWVWLAVGEVPANATIIGGAVVLFALVFNEIAAFRKES
jgi:drug/metabolite transporter (DMT)-like permease